MGERFQFTRGVCIECGSTDIEYDGMDYDFETMWVWENYICNNCGTLGENVYLMTFDENREQD